MSQPARGGEVPGKGPGSLPGPVRGPMQSRGSLPTGVGRSPGGRMLAEELVCGKGT